MNKDSSIVDVEIVESTTSTEQVASEKKAAEKSELGDRLLSAEHWLRFVFMVLFAIVACVASYVVAVLIIIQFLFALITGKRESRLRMFGGGLSTYLFQILQYLTYNSEEKPFPFKDWPEVEETDCDSQQG
ncbi:MAG: hypothetical protein ACJA0C_001291 [Candidatus Endobugula sp.]|jgi:hypothetical protein